MAGLMCSLPARRVMRAASSNLISRSGCRFLSSMDVAAVPTAKPPLILRQVPEAQLPCPPQEVGQTGFELDEVDQVDEFKWRPSFPRAVEDTLNPDMWGKHTDIPSMAEATDKQDIIRIVENFMLIRRTHVHLFRRLKCTMLASIDTWSASDLSRVCHAWSRLGFMHEDMCVAMASRVVATAHTCNVEELCWLMDAYATARCTVSSVIDELIVQSVMKIEEFTPPQLCLHLSSVARLNERSDRMIQLIADRLVRELKAPEKMSTAECSPVLSATDLTLAAYSFAKLGFDSQQLWAEIDRNAVAVIRDCTARDLQMLAVAFARVEHRSIDLFDAISVQAQRRIAQFNADSLVLLLRAFAFFGVRDMALFTRVIAQLPRNIVSFRSADVATLLAAFAAARVHSDAFVELVTPVLLEKASTFTQSDWESVRRSCMALGIAVDPMVSHLHDRRRAK